MRRSDRPGPQRGFTLVEAVVVIAITGVLAAIVSTFMVPAVQSYFATRARAALVDNADLALRRIGRDLRVALPNSTRITASGLGLELIPTTGAARYMAEGANRLQFGTLASAFDIIGPPLTVATAQTLVFYNLGAGVTGSDAYAANATAGEQAQSNRRTSITAAGDANALTMNSLTGLPVAAYAAPHRVFAVDSPVSYRCDLGTGQLTRHQDYGFVATQPDPPSGGSSAVLATGVAACSFRYDGAAIAARAALVTLALTLSATTPHGSETVTLNHAVHVDNLP